MRVPRIYHPGPLMCGETVTLNEQAARHLVKVLRLAAGAPLVLFDGRGHACAARLVETRPARATLDETLAPAPEPVLEIELLQALSRGAKMDLVVQKAVELGVTSLIPVIAERSVMRVDAEQGEKKRAHWTAVTIGACEQCGRDRLPAVHAPIAFAHAIAHADDATLNLVLDPEAESGPAATPAPRRVRLLIGPEGGLAPTELALARRGGFRPMRLGPRILRTETAALAAIATLQTLWGDFRP